MFGPLFTSFGEVLQLQYFVPLVIGTTVGLVGGVLPGVTITMTIIIVLPFTFGLDPLAGLASFIGGLLGAFFLVGATGPLAAFALQFGPWEYFSLFVFALSMVAGLTEAS